MNPADVRGPTGPAEEELRRRHDASARTVADVRLETARARATDPIILAGELHLARNRLANARTKVALEALGFARLVDRAAAATSQAWVEETLGLTEDGILDLVRSQTPNLMELGDTTVKPEPTGPRAA